MLYYNGQIDLYNVKRVANMLLRCASFNVLADTYTRHGDLSHVPTSLLKRGARLPHLVRFINELRADIICLQEVEYPLVTALRATNSWQTHWSRKTSNAPDGCLMLVRHGITVRDLASHSYSDRSGHIMQSMTVMGVTFVNTHIKWSKSGSSGVAQIKELLELFETAQRAVILADCNDRPGGPVRALIERAGFTIACGNEPTALINQQPAAIDVIAAQGVRVRRIETAFRPENIPSTDCPSDHIPIMAGVEVN